MTWEVILYVLGLGFSAWFLYRYVNRNPQSFSMDNLAKTAYTLGLLALALIGFIWLCVLILK